MGGLWLFCLLLFGVNHAATSEAPSAGTGQGGTEMDLTGWVTAATRAGLSQGRHGRAGRRSEPSALLGDVATSQPCAAFAALLQAWPASPPPARASLWPCCPLSLAPWLPSLPLLQKNPTFRHFVYVCDDQMGTCIPVPKNLSFGCLLLEARHSQCFGGVGAGSFPHHAPTG